MKAKLNWRATNEACFFMEGGENKCCEEKGTPMMPLREVGAQTGQAF
jgi:hypothetical protein